ncbi:MAG: SHOCT domain-containing protein [Proteobacteria bacterium]|jgi:putative membrane protein|nr:SHOCT domain-containing protein [Pseudomonadota bacterium]
MWGCNYTGAGLGHWFFGGGLWGLGITVIILGIIVVVALKLVRASQHTQHRKPEDADRLDSLMILKDRFAKGQITEQEYKKMKEVLSA